MQFTNALFQFLQAILSKIGTKLSLLFFFTEKKIESHNDTKNSFNTSKEVQIRIFNSQAI